MPNIKSIVLNGTHGAVVEVECKLSNSLPGLVIVGLATKAVDEAKERIRAAFSSANIPLPQKRITINLAPADIQKEGTSLDLAIALAIMAETKQIKPALVSSTVVLGELGLDGIIRPVRGVIGRLNAAREAGFTHAIVPMANSQQAQLIPGLEVLCAASLRDVYKALSGVADLASLKPTTTPQLNKGSRKPTIDISHIAGQKKAKRAIEIAAAGGHNILLSGPPGPARACLQKHLLVSFPT
jgi:magnesium chelatase family protein